MVEGRISAGVVVGADTDVGGGASIMGTLSGGGKEVITVGEECLIGANAGIGISLGDRCIVEAGLYVTAGTIVTTARRHHRQGPGAERRARTCSSAATPPRGAVEVLPRSGDLVRGAQRGAARQLSADGSRRSPAAQSLRRTVTTLP